MTAAILLMGHGSPDPGAHAELRELRDLVSVRLRRPVSLGVLEFACPGLPPLRDALADLGREQLVVAQPLLLFPGLHGRHDMPGVAEDAAARFGLEVRLGAPFGQDPDLVQLAVSRLARTGPGPREDDFPPTPALPREGGGSLEDDFPPTPALPREGRGSWEDDFPPTPALPREGGGSWEDDFPPTPALPREGGGSEDLLLFVGRGSSEPAARHEAEEVAAAVAAKAGLEHVVCYTGISRPLLAEGMRLALTRRPRRVLALPYLLHTGVLARRVAEVLEPLAARAGVDLAVLPHLGNAPQVIELVARRVEALLDLPRGGGGSLEDDFPPTPALPREGGGSLEASLR